jgi:hypothetical protein
MLPKTPFQVQTSNKTTVDMDGTGVKIGKVESVTYIKTPVAVDVSSMLCRSPGGSSPTSHRGGPGSSPGKVMWDLW